MTVVAVIAEYNPFHIGHMHHFDCIRKQFGDDCAILVLLSSNFVQRGDVAVFDKYTRAEFAISCGANLVLELPYPYSCASAEAYATSAVHILTELGCVDFLSFGSESGDITALQTAADHLNSEKYQAAFLSAAKANRSIGHASLSEKVYAELFGNAALLTTPNNTLGLEYLSAIKRLSSPLAPHTVLREGDYHTGKGKYPSASALRRKLQKGAVASLQNNVPDSCFPILERELHERRAPALLSKLSPSLIPMLLQAPPASPNDFADCNGGLGCRLMEALTDVYNVDDWLSRARSHKFTLARIRRAMLHLSLGTTSDMISSPPAYSQLLACDKTGQQLLKAIKKGSHFTILTKPADYVLLPPEARAQAQVSHRADLMYAWSLPAPQSAVNPLRRTPYCEK